LPALSYKVLASKVQSRLPSINNEDGLVSGVLIFLVIHIPGVQTSGRQSVDTKTLPTSVIFAWFCCWKGTLQLRLRRWRQQAPPKCLKLFTT